MVELFVLDLFYFLSRPISRVENLSTHRLPQKALRHRPPGSGTNHKCLRVDGRVSNAPSLAAVMTGHWRLVAGDGAEPMGAATRESPRSARKRDQYKLWREISFSGSCPVKHRRKSVACFHLLAFEHGADQSRQCPGRLQKR